MKIYLIGSLRNPAVPALGRKLRADGHDVFDDWYAASEDADDWWMEYEKAKGHTYREALKGHAATHVFNFDRQHLDESEAGVLLLPAGKSGHIELGYLAGQGKPTYIVMDGEPERYDVMYRFATAVVYNTDELLEALALLW